MLDAASGTRELVLEVLPGSRLRPGSAVTVQLGAERRQVVTIPKSAVAKEGYALVLEDNRTSLRAVTLGREVGADRVEVVSGISPGREGRPHRAMSALAKLRSDLVLVEQTYRGEQSYIVKDPEVPEVFPLSPRSKSRSCWRSTGSAPPTEAAAVLAEGDINVSASAVEKFAGKLKAMGLLERTLGERSVLMMERLRAQRRSRLSGGGLFQGDILRLRWSMGDPDKFMDRTLPYVRFCFTRAFLIASVVLFAIYLLVIALKWGDFSRAVVDLYTFNVSAGTLAVFWLTGTAIIVVHELGHGYTCKYFGGQVHEIGAMLLYFEPAFFCNVNDAWTFPDLKARLWVTAAGSWIQLVLASIASIVWWAATPGSLVSEVALAARHRGWSDDGAHECQSADSARRLLRAERLSRGPQSPAARLCSPQWLVRTRVFRLDIPMPPSDERERRIFLIYGLLAAAYIASIFLAFGGLMFGWLDRVLGGLGIAVFLVGLWLMTRATLREWRSTVMSAWRERRASLRGRPFYQKLLIAALAIVLLGAIIPRPITVTGSFVAAPARLIPLTSPDSGVVERVYARQGTWVGAGDTAGRDPRLRPRAKSARGSAPVRFAGGSRAPGTSRRQAGRGGPARSRAGDGSCPAHWSHRGPRASHHPGRGQRDRPHTPS